MLSDFITDLKQSKYYNNILDKHDVIMLYVSGSRIIDVTDERSDYDLIAVVNESEVVESEEFLIYNGVKVHWYYIPLSEFIAQKGNHSLRCYGAVLFANIRDEVVVYINPAHEALSNFLITTKNIIACNGMKNFCDRQARLIQSVVEAGEVLPEHYTKILGHLCVTSMAATGERISDETRNFLREIKRIRWQPVSDEAKKWCVERLKLLKHLSESGLNVAHSVL